jgi:hypothetical protein
MKLSIVSKFNSEHDIDLEPSDPSTGVIMAQGHIVFHLVYGIIILFFVNFEDEESYTCFQYDKITDAYVQSKDSTPDIN